MDVEDNKAVGMAQEEHDDVYFDGDEQGDVDEMQARFGRPGAFRYVFGET